MDDIDEKKLLDALPYIEKACRKIQPINWEDLYSTSIERITLNIRKHDPSKGEFQSWCGRIIRNTFIDQFRTKYHRIKSNSHELTSEMNISADASGVDIDLDNEMILEMSIGMIRREKYKNALIMYLEGYKIREIQEKLGINKTVFYRHIKDIKRMIRKN